MLLNTKLEDYLEFELSGAAQSEDLRRVIGCLAASASELARKISQNALTDLHNSIELVAFGLFEYKLRDAPVGMLISEKFEEPQIQNPQSDLAVVIHPLEGAVNIESAMPFGSLFSIHRLADTDTMREFSRDSIVAAGFFIYGPQTQLVLSCGAGTSIFTLNLDSAQFFLSREHVTIPQQQHEFAIDISNYRFWDGSIRHYFDDCVAGSDGPLGVDYEIRWNSSMLVEAYRILLGGGVYIYPDDARPGFENGKHKLLYEALAIGFLVEQAGGKASDGFGAIGERKLGQLETRVPLIFGAADSVEQVLEYISGDPSETTRFPLFENRSLFRN